MRNTTCATLKETLTSMWETYKSQYWTKIIPWLTPGRSLSLRGKAELRKPTSSTLRPLETGYQFPPLFLISPTTAAASKLSMICTFETSSRTKGINFFVKLSVSRLKSFYCLFCFCTFGMGRGMMHEFIS